MPACRREGRFGGRTLVQYNTGLRLLQLEYIVNGINLALPILKVLLEILGTLKHPDNSLQKRDSAYNFRRDLLQLRMMVWYNKNFNRASTS